MRYSLLLLMLALLTACNSEEIQQLQDDNSELEATVERVTTRADSLQAILTQLQQTDNYYYQAALESRKNEKYQESTAYLDDLIQRFPQSQLIGEARRLIRQNREDIVQRLYERVESAHADGRYSRAITLADQLIEKYPSDRRARSAKQIKTNSENTLEQQRKEQRERQLRAGSDLELITWSWGSIASGSYVKATGQVKNISGRSLENVTAVVSFFDSNGDFITSDDALIDYNPLLSGQTSPFSVTERRNPAMKTARVEFKYLMGGTIPTYNPGN